LIQNFNFLPSHTIIFVKDASPGFSFTPLESPDIYAGDVINRKYQLLVKAGSKPHLSNGVYSRGWNAII
jgi:hypothetical protein